MRANFKTLLQSIQKVLVIVQRSILSAKILVNNMHEFGVSECPLQSQRGSVITIHGLPPGEKNINNIRSYRTVENFHAGFNCCFYFCKPVFGDHAVLWLQDLHSKL